MVRKLFDSLGLKKKLMKKEMLFALITMLASFGIIGMAVISSFGKVMGYATVKPGIVIDILGSSNDESYILPSVSQGETKFSPEIKIENTGNSTVLVNFTLSVLPESAGTNKDVKLSLVNEFKNETFSNPLTILPSDTKVFIKHDFSSTSNFRNYSFEFELIPV